MEIVFANNFKRPFKKGIINGVVGDLKDLEHMNYILDGIIYDDNWTVKRLLNGRHLKYNTNIDELLSYLDIDNKVLNKRIKDLSKTDFKIVLLMYTIISDSEYIIFDNFEIGLTHKMRKKIIRIIKDFKENEKNVIVISRDLVFLSKVIDEIHVIKNKKVIYSGNILDLIEKEIVDLPPIVDFINLANKKKAKLEMTLDMGELLKDIYRSVGL